MYRLAIDHFGSDVEAGNGLGNPATTCLILIPLFTTDRQFTRSLSTYVHIYIYQWAFGESGLIVIKHLYVLEGICGLGEKWPGI